ncbi:MAG: UbiD family decarboxylase [Alphaproteobacteria bacterium]|nr:UbiD family decarboxylase [Alphaproteobacteria bacterium]
MPVRDIRSLLRLLHDRGELAVIEAEVDPHLELAEIHRRVIAAGGPALLFTNPKGHDIPVVTNLFGTADRATIAFGGRPKQFVEGLVDLVHRFPPTAGTLWGARDLVRQGLAIGTRKVRRAPVMEVVEAPRLDRLPMITSWPLDGGAFVTLPLVYTEHPDTHVPNLGMYRIQRHSPTTTGMHWQIGKGGGFHHAVAQARGDDLPVSVLVGGPPALVLSAIAPLPENVPELLLASLLVGERLRTTDGPAAHRLVADCEVALVGRVRPHDVAPEGPFGDHYGYYSWTHDYPVLHVDHVARRRKPIWPATVVGKPRQEDLFIGDYLQDLLSPVFPLVMPAVRDLWSYGETGYHALAAAVVQERYRREAMGAAFRVLGEGQLALTKFLWVLDQPVDLKDPKAVLPELLRRFRPETDLYVLSNLSMDTLDYTGPRVNEGSKGVMLGVGEPWRELPRHFSGSVPAGITDVAVFCPGVLVVSGPSWKEEPALAERIAGAFEDWPLVVVADEATRTASTSTRFLWTTFTRFEPAADLYATRTRVHRHHLVREGSILIDARFKDEYPDELFCDPDTARKVDDRWKAYFPDGGVEMGDSDAGHLDEA